MTMMAIYAPRRAAYHKPVKVYAAIRLPDDILHVGKLERRQPLPPGRYWVDVFGDKRAQFSFWLETSPGVMILATESFPANGGPERDWYLFKTTMPVAWDALNFGYPTIADETITSSDDTVQKPEAEPVLGGFFDMVFSPPGIIIGAGLLGLGLLAYLKSD